MSYKMHPENMEWQADSLTSAHTYLAVTCRTIFFNLMDTRSEEPMMYVIVDCIQQEK